MTSQADFSILQVLTPEQRAAELADRIRKHEEQAHPIARDVYALYLAHEARRVGDNAIPPFKPWLTSFGVPEGSVGYYLDVGAALVAGLGESVAPAAPEGEAAGTAVPERPAAPAPTPVAARDLRAAGSAIRSGAPLSEVRSAIQQGTVRDYASAHHNGGTVSIRLALPAKEVWDEQTRRWQHLTKLPALETQALMVTSLQYVNDEDVKAIARAGEIVEEPS